MFKTGFTLLPDNYVIKLLARDTVTGRIGTYQASLTVPNLNKEETRVPISTVVLSAQHEPLGNAISSVRQKVDSNVGNPLVFEGHKLVPSVTRVFSKSRDLYVFLQAYQHDATEMRPLIAFVSFYRDDVKVMETRPSR